MDYKVEFLDSSLKLLGIVNREATVSFEWTKYSGCGRFSIDLARKFDDWSDIVAFQNVVKIYVNGVLWYTGFIQDYTPSFVPQEGVKIVGIGFIDQLNWSDTTWVYQSFEISQLVSQLVGDRITQYGLNITLDPANIEDTTFIVDVVAFSNQKTKEAIDTLRKLVADYDYGVDESMRFYFRRTDRDTIQYDSGYKYDSGNFYERNLPKVWVLPKRYIESYEPIYSSSQMANRIILVGGRLQGATENNIYIYEDMASISTYKPRETVESNQSIISETAAQLYCTARLTETANPVKRAHIVLRGYEALIKPGYVIEVRDDDGSVIDTHETLSASYDIDDNGIRTTIEADRPTPNIMKDFRLVKLDISALQNVSPLIQSYLQQIESLYYTPTTLISEGSLWWNDALTLGSLLWDIGKWEGEVNNYTLTLVGGGGGSRVVTM